MIGTCQSAITAAMPEPTSPPILQNAWNPAKIDRPYTDSTHAACAFIDTSSKLFPMPSTTRVPTSTGRFGAKATSGSPAHITAAPSTTPVLLLIQVSSGPAQSNANTAPTANPNTPIASCPAVRPSFCCTAGTLAAQVDNPVPQTTNETETPNRARRAAALTKGAGRRRQRRG